MHNIHLAGGNSGQFYGEMTFLCPTFTTSFRSIKCVFQPFNYLEGRLFYISSSRIQREIFQ